MGIELRDFQTEAVQRILDYYIAGKQGNPLVVAPTGSGKSIIIGAFCSRIHRQWPGTKILVISHVKEILEQDCIAIRATNPGTDIGIYSAGLKSKKTGTITVASIQTIFKHAEKFQDFQIVLVDEVHTVPHKGEGMYRQFLGALKKPTIGMTATPFRLGTGYLHIGEGAMFSEIVYNIELRTLIKQGFLSPITAKGTKTRLDPSGIKKSGGDFVKAALARKFDKAEITNAALDEVVLYKDERKKWLIFATVIGHAEHIAEELVSRGIKAAAVHSKSPNREELIDGYKNGDIQALVSVAVLTTGFDAPETDLVVLLRPTASPVLHVQIIGRGMRIAPGKKDCLVLDFAGNLIRNGPIDNPLVKINRGDGTGEPIMKECPACYEIVHAATRFCPCCNHEFLFKHKLEAESSATGKVLTSIDWYPVYDVKYSKYQSKAGNNMIKVAYQCGLGLEYNQFVMIGSRGYAGYKAAHWWSRRAKNPTPPQNLTEFMTRHQELLVPKEILVDDGGRYPDIKDFKF